MMCSSGTLAFVSILLLDFLVVSRGASLLSSSPERAREENVCLTPGCVKAATRIQNNLDESIDPCTDFYQFACGGWQKKHEIPSHKSSISTISNLQDHLDSKVKALVEKQITENDLTFVKLTKTLYRSCTNVETIENLKESPLRKAVEAVGGWPVVVGDKWDESKFDLVDTLVKLRSMGYSHTSLLNADVEVDFKDTLHFIITIDQPSLGMPDRSYFLEGLSNNISSVYFDFMKKVAIKLGSSEEAAQAELLKVFQFETQLANFSLPMEERRDFNKLYNKFTVQQLPNSSPQINWLKFLRGVISTQITEDEPVVVGVPSYVENLSKLISASDKRTIANYLVWRMIRGSLLYLSKEWRDLTQDYTRVLIGVAEEKPREDHCLGAVRSNLGVALGAFYIKNHFQAESREAALKMVGYLLKEFFHILETVDWMESSTKQKAIEKAKAIIPYIGYPDQLQNDTAVTEYYAGLTLDENSFYDNIRKLHKFEVDRNSNQLRDINQKGSQWDMIADEVANVDAYNNLLENSIIFPAGILQGAFFSKDQPNYLNFGAIGYVIGHEVTHGFDDSGKQFDKDGNNVNWWDPKTDQHFKDKVQCVIDQYSNYTVEEVGMNVNGINTQGENVADNGGMREAYTAYHSWVKDNGKEGKLPGLKYTPDQLFWISTANAWCANFKPAAMKLIVLTEVHSPEKYRIIGALSNIESFSSDFNCPLGTPMNPQNKCRVW